MKKGEPAAKASVDEWAGGGGIETTVAVGELRLVACREGVKEDRRTEAAWLALKL